MGRVARTGITSVIAGCFVCHPGAKWSGKNALAVAARHHDATGHSTWCEQVLSVRYGDGGGATDQLKLFECGGEG